MSFGGNAQDFYRENNSNLENTAANVERNFMQGADIEEFCRKIEKDARRYKRFLGNDSQVILI